MAYNKFYQTPYKKTFATGLRNNPTTAEAALWKKLQNAQRKNNRFVRQKVILGWIVDFYTHDSRVAIEVDGVDHLTDEKKKSDALRTRALNKSGIYVLRVTNYDVLNNIDSVLAKIDDTLVLKSDLKVSKPKSKRNPKKPYPQIR